MDAAAELRAARPEEEEEREKPVGGGGGGGCEGAAPDDGYETSNSGERRAPAEPSPPPRDPLEPPPEPPAPPPPQPQPPPPQPPPHHQPQPQPQPQPQQQPQPQPQHHHDYEQLMRHYPSPYRQFDQPPAPPPDQEYQHFPFPKYNEPYGFKREPEAPYDMSQHPAHAQYAHKRDEDAYNGVKRECDDPYSFVEEEAMSLMLGGHHQLAHHEPPHHPHLLHQQQMMLNQPKKRGRKKKIKDENGMEIKAEGMEGMVPRPVKERKKHDRFNGMSEEEVARRTLPDHLAENLDIIIIGINPGLFAAYKGHHYAGPGNHFWKCLYLSGLTREQMSADEDYKLLNFGIGFTNMVSRATKGSADLTRREIKEGSAVLLEKLQTFRPKVAVFNGKLIYEVFSGKKDFCFGKQPDTIAGTNTYMWVMPSSSARCAQLPRAADKVPFYAALKKFRDYLNGLEPHLDEAELVFPDTTQRRPHEEMEIRRLTMEPEPGDTIILEDGTEVPLKKKRGRPKKVKLENGELAPPTPRAPRPPRPPPALDAAGDQPPKKKRGRPKKIRPEEQHFLLQQQQQQQQHQQQQQPGPGVGGVGGVGGVAGGAHEPQYAQGQFPPNMYDQPYFPHQPAGGGMEGNMELNMRGGYASPGPGGAGAGGGAGGYGSPRAHYASPRGYSPGAGARASPAGAGYLSPGAGTGAGGGGAGAGRGGYAASPGAAGQAGGAGALPPRYAPSPQYARSPAPMHTPMQTSGQGYAQSPAPAGSVGATTPFPAASPAGAGGAGAGPLHSYTPSPQHTPYSQHSSPAPPPRTPTYTDAHHYQRQGGGSTGSVGSYSAELGGEMAALSPAASPPAPLDFEPPSPAASTDMHPGSSSNSSLGDQHKANSANSEMSPAGVSSVGSVGGAAVGVGVGGGYGGLFDGDRLQYPHPHPHPHPHLHASPHPPHAPSTPDHYHYQEQGGGVPESPRMEQMHQHPAMYATNYNRATPEGGGGGEASFRPPEPHTPHHPGSPAEYGGAPKTKPQDVSSKSLSGLESLVDQIPSIAEGPAGAGAGGAGAGSIAGGAGAAAANPGDAPPVSALAEYAPALYPPYGAYGGAPYGNNGYGAPFVGYGGGWGGAVLRPAPGYLPEWQYPYPGAPYPPAAYSAPYYNGYTPPPAHAHAQQHYLSAPGLLELHKNGEHAAGVPSVPSVPSVGFGGFC